MKNRQGIVESTPSGTVFIERRGAVRELAGQALATREPHGEEVRPFHYPVAPYEPGRCAIHEDLVALAQPFGDRAEEFRSLRTELLQGTFASRNRALAILSQDTGDGKSYVAANLAVSLSQLGGDTLLVDANLRAPRLHALLRMPVRPGLPEVLSGQAQPEEAISPVPGVPGLHLLAGLRQVVERRACADPLRLLQGPRLRALLVDLLARFDQILVDTPANAAGPDARVIAVQAGAALIVGRSGHTRVALLQKLLAQLNRSPTQVAGVVLNQH
jgi:receptor protein-tyrosine kinase